MTGFAELQIQEGHMKMANPMGQTARQYWETNTVMVCSTMADADVERDRFRFSGGFFAMARCICN
jgi:hypothetical protein